MAKKRKLWKINWISCKSSIKRTPWGPTNNIKARIDKTQQDSRFSLLVDGDETINHVINQCRKLAQNAYKGKHNWVGKLIYRDLCKKLKFDKTNKWYMHNLAFFLENDTHKLLWEFDIQTYQVISPKRLELVKNTKQKKIAEVWTLLSWLTTEWNWKKVKRRITLLGN